MFTISGSRSKQFNALSNVWISTNFKTNLPLAEARGSHQLGNTKMSGWCRPSQGEPLLSCLSPDPWNLSRILMRSDGLGQGKSLTHTHVTSYYGFLSLKGHFPYIETQMKVVLYTHRVVGHVIHWFIRTFYNSHKSEPRGAFIMPWVLKANAFCKQTWKYLMHLLPDMSFFFRVYHPCCHSRKYILQWPHGKGSSSSKLSKWVQGKNISAIDAQLGL